MLYFNMIGYTGWYTGLQASLIDTTDSSDAKIHRDITSTPEVFEFISQ